MVRNSATRTGGLVRMRVRTNEWPPSRPGLYCIRLGVIHASPKRSIETNTHPLRKGERRSISLQDSAMPGENCRVDHDTVSGDIGDAARQPVSNSGDAPAHESSSQAAGEGIADESLHGVGARTRHVGVSRCPGPASRSGRRTDQHCGSQPIPSESGRPCGTGHFPRHTQHPGEGHLAVGGVPGGGRR